MTELEVEELRSCGTPVFHGRLSQIVAYSLGLQISPDTFWISIETMIDLHRSLGSKRIPPVLIKRRHSAAVSLS